MSKAIIRKHKKCLGCGEFHDYWLITKIKGKQTLRCILCAGSDNILLGDQGKLLDYYFMEKYAIET